MIQCYNFSCQGESHKADDKPCQDASFSAVYDDGLAMAIVCDGHGGERYFRSDVDYDIISRIGEDAVRFVMESRMYKEYSLQHIFRNIIFLFLRGFSTEKGIKMMDRMFEEGGVE